MTLQKTVQIHTKCPTSWSHTEKQIYWEAQKKQERHAMFTELQAEPTRRGGGAAKVSDDWNINIRTMMLDEMVRK